MGIAQPYLILALLNCPQGKEQEILSAHSSYINETLTQYLLETAEYLRQQGSLADADRLLENNLDKLNERLGEAWKPGLMIP